ncbi:MAG TPA: peptidyl-prolyl cis-trans isomerase [Blastocatellia bacterium]|nr:peptidyl-prolyl cis-trans isomerase [Blastocatellia bacterium]
MKAFNAWVATAVIFLAWVTAGAQNPELGSEVVARVNNETIPRADYVATLKEFKEELGRQMRLKSQAEFEGEYQRLKRTVLSSMIEGLLLDQKFRELGIDVRDVEAEVGEQIGEFCPVRDPIELDEQMKANGIDPERARGARRKRLQREYVIQKEVWEPLLSEVTDKDRREYYDRHQDRFVIPGEVVLSEIFLPLDGSTPEAVEAWARRLVTQLRAGADWVESVRDNTPLSRPSRAQNGRMGSFKLEDLTPEVGKMISSMKPGEVTDPIKLQDGFQIVRLDGRRPPAMHGIEEPAVQNLLDRAIVSDWAKQRQREYLEALRAEADIDIDAKYRD